MAALEVASSAPADLRQGRRSRCRPRWSRPSRLAACCIFASSIPREVGAQLVLGDFPTTVGCRLALADMVSNVDWQFMNKTMQRWCRVRLENKMSQCCTNPEFANGKADGCEGECFADCQHQQMMSLCNKEFGTACTLDRKPFHQTGLDFMVRETFCVPRECDNNEDMQANRMVKYYGEAFKTLGLWHWHFDYSEAELSCPSSTAIVIVSVFIGIIGAIAFVPVAFFLFKAPKERGRMLLTQEEMQDPHPSEYGADETLRSAAGGEMLGMPAITAGGGAEIVGAQSTDQTW